MKDDQSQDESINSYVDSLPFGADLTAALDDDEAGSGFLSTMKLESMMMMGGRSDNNSSGGYSEGTSSLAALLTQNMNDVDSELNHLFSNETGRNGFDNEDCTAEATLMTGGVSDKVEVDQEDGGNNKVSTALFQAFQQAAATAATVDASDRSGSVLAFNASNHNAMSKPFSTGNQIFLNAPPPVPPKAVTPALEPAFSSFLTPPQQDFPPHALFPQLQQQQEPMVKVMMIVDPSQPNMIHCPRQMLSVTLPDGKTHHTWIDSSELNNGQQNQQGLILKSAAPQALQQTPKNGAAAALNDLLQQQQQLQLLPPAAVSPESQQRSPLNMLMSATSVALNLLQPPPPAAASAQGVRQLVPLLPKNDHKLPVLPQSPVSGGGGSKSAGGAAATDIPTAQPSLLAPPPQDKPISTTTSAKVQSKKRKLSTASISSDTDAAANGKGKKQGKSSSKKKKSAAAAANSGETAVATPLRALSAYNYFFRHERDRIIHGKNCTYTVEEQDRLLQDHYHRDRSKKRRHRKTHGKVDFTTLSRTISNRWKELTEETKDFYRQLAARDWKRYQTELAAFNCGDANSGESTCATEEELVSKAPLAPLSSEYKAVLG